MSEIKQHFDDLHREFNEFKKYNDQKIETLEESSLSKGDLDERLDRLTEKMNKSEADIAAIQTKENRPELGPHGDNEKLEIERKEIFGKYLRTGKSSLSSIELKTLQEGSGGGQYLAPSEFVRDLTRRLQNRNPVRQLCRQITGESKQLDIPGQSVGMTANWVAEAASITPADPTFVEVTVPAHKLACETDVSNELIQDADFSV